MKLPPTEVILSWPAPEYAHPHTRGDALLIVNSVFIGLTAIVVGLRMYTRLILKRWFGLDDIFILLALVFAVGFTAVVLLAVQQFGWNRHIYDIPITAWQPTLKVAMAAKVVYISAGTFTRLSLHCFYYRLVTNTGMTWFSWCIHLNVAYTVGVFLAIVFLAIFACTPVSDYWAVGPPPGSCMDDGIATLACGIINCVADFATTVTPIPLILGLHMPFRQKLAVASLFAMGIIVTVAGVVRTWFIYVSLIAKFDTTWYAYPLYIAAAIEVDLGIICASAPVLKPLFSKISLSLSGTFSGAFSGGNSLKNISTGTGDDSTSSTAKNPRISIPSTTNLSSRRADAIHAVPDLNRDQGRSYELANWDEENAVSNPPPMDQILRTQSGDAILRTEVDEQASKGGSLTQIWQRMKPQGWGFDSEGSSKDMTIRMTSEVELSNEPVSANASKRNTRYRDVFKQHRATKDHKSPSPLESQGQQSYF